MHNQLIQHVSSVFTSESLFCSLLLVSSSTLFVNTDVICTFMKETRFICFVLLLEKICWAPRLKSAPFWIQPSQERPRRFYWTCAKLRIASFISRQEQNTKFLKQCSWMGWAQNAGYTLVCQHRWPPRPLRQGWFSIFSPSLAVRSGGVNVFLEGQNGGVTKGNLEAMKPL